MPILQQPLPSTFEGDKLQSGGRSQRGPPRLWRNRSGQARRAPVLGMRHGGEAQGFLLPLPRERGFLALSPSSRVPRSWGSAFSSSLSPGGTSPGVVLVPFYNVPIKIHIAHEVIKDLRKFGSKKALFLPWFVYKEQEISSSGWGWGGCSPNSTGNTTTKEITQQQQREGGRCVGGFCCLSFPIASPSGPKAGSLCPWWLYRVFVQVKDTAVCLVTHLPASFVKHFKLAHGGGGTPKGFGSIPGLCPLPHPLRPPNMAEPEGFCSLMSTTVASHPHFPQCAPSQLDRGAPSPHPKHPQG